MRGEACVKVHFTFSHQLACRDFPELVCFLHLAHLMNKKDDEKWLSTIYFKHRTSSLSMLQSRITSGTDRMRKGMPMRSFAARGTIL